MDWFDIKIKWGRTRLIALPLLILITNISSANDIKPIDSPDMYYLAWSEGVSQIRVIGEKDKDGDYKIEMVSIMAIEPFKAGNIYGKGWWYPSSQQISSQNYNILPSLRHCDHWGKLRWSSVFTPKRVSVSGKTAVVHISDTINPMRQSEAQCIDVKVYRRTCEIHSCNKYKPQGSHSLITKSKSVALDYYYFGEEKIKPVLFIEKALNLRAKLVSASCRKNMSMAFLIVSTANKKGWSGDPLDICDCFGERIVKTESDEVVAEFYESFDRYTKFTGEEQASYYKACMPN